jgi:hypothetical protein
MSKPDHPVSGGFLASEPPAAAKSNRPPEVAIPPVVFIDPGWPADEPDDDSEE